MLLRAREIYPNNQAPSHQLLDVRSNGFGSREAMADVLHKAKAPKHAVRKGKPDATLLGVHILKLES